MFTEMKKTYIIPSLTITKLTLERMVAVSGPQVTSTAADSKFGMDVKADRTYQNHNVWDDDWSK